MDKNKNIIYDASISGKLIETFSFNESFIQSSSTTNGVSITKPLKEGISNINASLISIKFDSIFSGVINKQRGEYSNNIFYGIMGSYSNSVLKYSSYCSGHTNVNQKINLSLVFAKGPDNNWYPAYRDDGSNTGYSGIDAYVYRSRNDDFWITLNITLKGSISIYKLL